MGYFNRFGVPTASDRLRSLVDETDKMVTRLGGASIIMEKFDAETALSLIQEHGITHCQWVPTMFVRLLQLPEEVRRSYDTSTMKYSIHAAAPCPVAVKEQMIDWWSPTLYEYYSGTEANGQTTITTEQCPISVITRIRKKHDRQK